MQCPRCDAKNREGRRFCGECGLSFSSTCASCGFLKHLEQPPQPQGAKALGLANPPSLVARADQVIG
jgi:predicted amidophosphoribosyltransferase